MPTAQAKPTRQQDPVKDEVSRDWDPETIDHDESLIRWMLSLSPTKRLEVAQGFVDSVRILRDGFYEPVPASTAADGGYRSRSSTD